MKGSRFSEEQIIGILREAGAKAPEVWSAARDLGRDLFLWTAPPSGKKVLGPGLAVIDCKHLFGVTTLWCAQMGYPLTLSSTSGRPRGPL